MKHLMLKLTQILLVCAVLLGQQAQASDNLTQAELDQMLAPVALYPDTVLTHVLIAATYPLEVVQAARWVETNPNINGEDAVRAVESQDWDPSVKALVAFPQLLQRLSDDLDWTQQLGEAFLADESAVLASIQQLREKAYSSGNLQDNEQIVVQRERQVIVIEPARQEVVYVPVYDTRIVYGDWWWPSHPPVYWHTAGVHFRHNPFHWGISVRVRPWFYFGIFDWHQRHVVVHQHYYHKPPRYYPKRHKHYVDARRWHHNTEHRRGVHYRHERLNRDYNTGYGYRQPTQETKGKPQRHSKHNDNVTVRESKQQYQRKTAEQVKLRERQWQPDEANARQRNEALRQARTEQRVISTEQLRQRDELHKVKPVRQHEPRQVNALPQQRIEAQQKQPVVREQRQPSQSVQRETRPPQREVRQPQREVQQVQREARQPQREVQQVQREARQPEREVLVKRQDSHNRSID